MNLIALNPGPGIAFQTPAQHRVLEFQNILTDSGGAPLRSSPFAAGYCVVLRETGANGVAGVARVPSLAAFDAAWSAGSTTLGLHNSP